VICYRTRSASARSARSLGLSADVVGALAGSVWGWTGGGGESQARELGLDPDGGRLGWRSTSPASSPIPRTCRSMSAASS